MPEKPQSIWILLSSPNVYTAPYVELSNGFREVFSSRLYLSLSQRVQKTMKNWVHQQVLGFASLQNQD